MSPLKDASMCELIANSPCGPEKCLDALRGIGRFQKAILNAREQTLGTGLVTPADERPCVGIQRRLNLFQIEYPRVRVMNHGFVFDEGMVTNIKNHGRVRIGPFGRYTDAHGVRIGIRLGYYDPEMLNVLSALRD